MDGQMDDGPITKLTLSTSCSGELKTKDTARKMCESVDSPELLWKVLHIVLYIIKSIWADLSSYHQYELSKHSDITMEKFHTEQLSF